MAVYFIKSGDFVKIGYAENPEKRIRGLQTGNPGKLELLGIIPGNMARERELHARFAKHRVKGEWFTLTPGIERLAATGRKQEERNFDELFTVLEVVSVALSGWRVERNSNGYFRFRWQMKDETGVPDTYATKTGNIGYRRGSQYLPIKQVNKKEIQTK